MEIYSQQLLVRNLNNYWMRCLKFEHNEEKRILFSEIENTLKI